MGERMGVKDTRSKADGGKPGANARARSARGDEAQSTARERSHGKGGPKAGEGAKALGSRDAVRGGDGRSTDHHETSITLRNKATLPPGPPPEYSRPQNPASFDPDIDSGFVPDLPTVRQLIPGPLDHNKHRVPSMKNVGRDKDGRTLPHQRSEQTAAVIANWVAMGAELNFIAAMLNIRPGIIKQHYPNELLHAAQMANMQVANAVFEAAVKDKDMTAAKFFLKSRAKWRDGDTAEGSTGSLFNIHIHG